VSWPNFETKLAVYNQGGFKVSGEIGKLPLIRTHVLQRYLVCFSAVNSLGALGTKMTYYSPCLFKEVFPMVLKMVLNIFQDIEVRKSSNARTLIPK
jgi:hypothetical protein